MQCKKPVGERLVDGDCLPFHGNVVDLPVRTIPRVLLWPVVPRLGLGPRRFHHVELSRGEGHHGFLACDQLGPPVGCIHLLIDGLLQFSLAGAVGDPVGNDVRDAVAGGLLNANDVLGAVDLYNAHKLRPGDIGDAVVLLGELDPGLIRFLPERYKHGL